MYNREVVEENPEYNNIDAILEEAQKLSTEEKAELIEKLLEKESGLIVVSASSHLADYIIAQMSLLSPEGLVYVLSETAPWITSDDQVFID
jgi:formate dehydrogenase maturation protein FdhE